MEIGLNHDNLNLFRSFGGDCANENNTTRAFLIALTRSPWGTFLLRAFLDLAGEKIAKERPDLRVQYDKFLSAWPQRVDFSMQTAATSSDIVPEELEVGALVVLAPSPEYKVDSRTQSLTRAQLAAGITDAVLMLRSSDGKAMTMVIESKLYGPASQQQLAGYMAAFGEKPCAFIEISWDDIYRLTNLLPLEGQRDPIIHDFRSFLDSRPHLVSFTGFRASDLRDSATLDMRLRRLCERIAVEGLVDRSSSTVVYTFAGAPQRKKEGSDYDLSLEHQTEMKGNLGIAFWGGDAIHSKLVVGYRTVRETDYLLMEDRYKSEEVRSAMELLCAEEGFRLALLVRVYFGYQQDESVEVFKAGPKRCEVATRWSQVIELAKRFHGKRASDELLEEMWTLAAQIGPPDPQVMNWAKELPEDSRPKCFAALAFSRERRVSELPPQAGRQVEVISEDLRLLARLLGAISRRNGRR